MRLDEITLDTSRPYIVKGLIPRNGLTVIWGPPKSGKSFFTFDLLMHVALDWDYRGRRVEQGPVGYCAFEGQNGIKRRVEAFRQQSLSEQTDIGVPFYLQPTSLDLVKDCAELIAAIRATLGDTKPIVVVLDTLNRSLKGSESSDEDMSAYVKAADAIREAFDCAVVIVHHCGVDGTRPRGHTSLTGATDAQLAVKRDALKNIVVSVEWMKDGDSEGDMIASRLEQVEVGVDEDGDPITSCVVTPAEITPQTFQQKRLTANEQAMLNILRDAGHGGMTKEDWNEKCREAGIGKARRADLVNCRAELKSRKLVYEFDDRWFVSGHWKRRGVTRYALHPLRGCVT